jgi:hypothetical protein
MTTRRSKPNFAALKRKLLTWPGVEESSHYGQPSIKAFGKFLTRLKEDGDSIVVSGVNFDEREMLSRHKEMCSTSPTTIATFRRS